MADFGADEASSKSESPEQEGQGSEDRSLLHQRLAIRELIDTEVSYLHMLRLCASDIRSHLQQLPPGDLDILFSNIDDIIQVSSRFLHGLQETACKEEDQVLLIGKQKTQTLQESQIRDVPQAVFTGAVQHAHLQSKMQMVRVFKTKAAAKSQEAAQVGTDRNASGNLFLEFQEEFERVYKVYCASYDQALLLVKAYQKEPELQKEIQGVIEAAVITKYPLLLQKILENTPADASAHPVLQRAASALQDVNSNINEYKMRKEVALKYTKVEQLSLRERLARINTHTLSKKTTRLSQLLKQEAGLVSRTEDKEFDDLEERFQWVSLCVTEMRSNVAAYMDNLETFLSFRPHERSLDIPGGPAEQYCSLARDLQLQAFLQFKQRLKGLVWQPLCSLARALVGPQNLIKKRLDKLLDFGRVEEKLLDVGSVTYEEEAARHTYQALNSLLVAELPQFNQLVMQWLGQILCTFVVLQRDLADQVLRRAESSTALLPHYGVSEPDFQKLLEDILGQSSSQLRLFQENFEKVLPPSTTQPLLPGSEHQMQALLTRYGPGKLYQVTNNINGTGTLDLTLPRGQIVALLQNKDTKGNNSRWLVDTGGHRGYVPAGKLQLYCPIVSSEKELRGQTGVHEDYWLPTPEPTQPSVPTVPTMSQVVAAYPFVARNTHELSLQAGQPVTILEAQDKKGNPEWSLVEANGQRGYVPSNFLTRTLSPTPWGWNLPS